MQTKHKIYTGLLSLNRAVASWQEITHAEHPAYMYTVFTNHILSNGQGTTITLRIICAIFSVKIHASSVKLGTGKSNWTIAGWCEAKCRSCQIWCKESINDYDWSPLRVFHPKCFKNEKVPLLGPYPPLYRSLFTIDHCTVQYQLIGGAIYHY